MDAAVVSAVEGKDCREVIKSIADNSSIPQDRLRHIVAGMYRIVTEATRIPTPSLKQEVGHDHAAAWLHAIPSPLVILAKACRLSYSITWLLLIWLLRILGFRFWFCCFFFIHFIVFGGVQLADIVCVEIYIHDTNITSALSVFIMAICIYSRMLWGVISPTAINCKVRLCLENELYHQKHISTAFQPCHKRTS